MKTRVSTSFFSSIFFVPIIACGGLASLAAADAPESPDGAVKYVVEGIVQHEPQRIWTALPASYQADINGLIGAFSKNLDPDVYDRGFQLLARFAGLLQDKKELFLASQMLPGTVDREEAAKNWDTFTGMIRGLATSDLASAEKLAGLDVERFLATTGATMLAEAEKSAKAADEDIFEDLRALEVEVVASGDEKATLRVTGADLAQEVEMVRVEGRWIPSQLADAWGDSMAQARQQVDQMSPKKVQAMKPQMLATFGMIEGTLAQLEIAETPQQLDAALQGAMFAIMGLFMGSTLQGIGTP